MIRFKIFKFYLLIALLVASIGTTGKFSFATPRFQFDSCTVHRSAKATPTPSIRSTATPTPTSTPIPTEAATLEAIEPDFIILQIVGERSEVCYEVGEIHAGEGFDLAVGVTNAVAGEIAIDRANLANSKVGDIVVNIDQLTSDQSMRDGDIRANYLETAKYPQATFSNIQVIGLPRREIKDGEKLKFQLVGTLQIRQIERQVIWNVTGSLTGDTLIAVATADILMTDYGVNPPDILGVVLANNDVHLVFNLIAQEPSAKATQAAQ
jgi:polyisoprenoid-binding protein YceI